MAADNNDDYGSMISKVDIASFGDDLDDIVIICLYI